MDESAKIIVAIKLYNLEINQFKFIDNYLSRVVRYANKFDSEFIQNFRNNINLTNESTIKFILKEEDNLSIYKYVDELVKYNMDEVNKMLINILTYL